MGLRMIVMGAPGAGKGTQTRRIVATWRVPHISTGEIFRVNMRSGTPLGELARNYIDEGHLVPDDVTCEVVAARLEEEDCRDGYVLDGFPRSRPQCEFLERMLEQREERLNLVVNLLVDDEEIVERLSARRMCPKCGAIYNLHYQPPQDNGYCDNTACQKVELTQRRDDYPETIRERLSVYHKTNAPVLAFYQQLNKLHQVEGCGRTPDAVFAEISSLVAASGPVGN